MPDPHDLPKGHDPHELAKIYFGAARAEILARLSMREQVLLAGFTTFGVIGGLAISGKAPELLSISPLLSIAFTLVLFRHHWLITNLSDYVNHELSPSLGIKLDKKTGIEQNKKSDVVLMPLHWDAWLRSPKGRYMTAPNQRLRGILCFELASQWLLIWVPGLTELGFFLLNKFQSNQPINWCGPVLSIDFASLAFALVPYVEETYRLAFRWNK